MRYYFKLHFLKTLGFAWLFFATLVMTACSSWKHEFEVFQDQVKHAANPQELQAWAQPIIQGRSARYSIQALDADERHMLEIQVADLPDSLKKINNGPYARGPEMAFLSETDIPGKYEIVVCWGGGFGHWGLEIGEKDFVESDTGTNSVVRWIDGVYFFKETK